MFPENLFSGPSVPLKTRGGGGHGLSLDVEGGEPCWVAAGAPGLLDYDRLDGGPVGVPVSAFFLESKVLFHGPVPNPVCLDSLRPPRCEAGVSRLSCERKRIPWLGSCPLVFHRSPGRRVWFREAYRTFRVRFPAPTLP